MQFTQVGGGTGFQSESHSRQPGDCKRLFSSLSMWRWRDGLIISRCVREGSVLNTATLSLTDVSDSGTPSTNSSEFGCPLNDWSRQLKRRSVARITPYVCHNRLGRETGCGFRGHKTGHHARVHGTVNSPASRTLRIRRSHHVGSNCPSCSKTPVV